MKGSLLLITSLLTGLSCGLFYAWSVSVIPGTRRITDLAYIETMQQINRAIINPWFLIIFLGPLLFFILSSHSQFSQGHMDGFAIIVVAGLIYLIGTVGVTAFGNVPLNEALDTVQAQQLDLSELQQVRLNYEKRWNRLHLVRTIFSLISFAICLLAIFTANKGTQAAF